MTQPTSDQDCSTNSKHASIRVVASRGVSSANTAPAKTVVVESFPSDSSDAPTISTKAGLLALFVHPSCNSGDAVGQAAGKVDEDNVSVARQQLYQTQAKRTRELYLASSDIRPTYLVQQLKSQFIEYQHHQMAVQLDKRGVIQGDSLRQLWTQLHLVDDLIAEVVSLMPAQKPVGWQISAQNRNHLQLPTVGKLRLDSPRQDLSSLNSYVLSHFGVYSYTYDRGYYIGHVAGYLFCCYYFAHLSLPYAVTPLSVSAAAATEYASLTTAQLVRLLQALDVTCKKRLYQLAVICARLSYYATDKRIEKMLIAEVNEFDKTRQQHHLDLLLRYGVMPESSSDGQSQ